MFIFPKLIDDKLYLLTTAVLTIVNLVVFTLSFGVMCLKNKYYNKC